jgi:multiple sugar transport system permease protein
MAREHSGDLISVPHSSQVRRLWRRSAQARAAYGFILPVLVLFLLFRVWPNVHAFIISFQDYRITGESEFLGLANYRRLIDDAVFWGALRVTIVYALIAVPLTTVLALMLALLINRTLEGIGFFRALFFLPYITSFVLVAVIWKWIYRRNEGLLNELLGIFSLGPFPWLESQQMVLPSIAIMAAWKGVGYSMMIFLAGIRGIPATYLEAAAVDGATASQRFFHITFPLLRPIVFFVVVIETISSFQVFDAIYVMTGGGPIRASYSLVYMMYDEGFRFFDFGYASSIGVVLFGMVLMVSLLQRAMFGRE